MSLFIEKSEALNNIALVCQTITQQGLCVIPSFLETDNWSDLRYDIEKAFKHESWAESYSQGRCVRLASHTKIVEKYPVISHIFASLWMEQIASLYFGQWKKQHRLNHQIYLTHEFRYQNAPITPLHFDRYHLLKFMIYMTDVDEKSGPFACVLGSTSEGRKLRQQAWKETQQYDSVKNNIFKDYPQNRLKDAKPYPILAPKGSLICFDTDTLHMGTDLSPGKERLVIRGHTQVQGIQDL